MEDKKNAAKLDDEQLEQVAGGMEFTECPVYQRIMGNKKTEYFTEWVIRTANANCHIFEHGFDCSGCFVNHARRNR